VEWKRINCIQRTVLLALPRHATALVDGGTTSPHSEFRIAAAEKVSGIALAAGTDPMNPQLALFDSLDACKS